MRNFAIGALATAVVNAAFTLHVLAFHEDLTAQALQIVRKRRCRTRRCRTRRTRRKGWLTGGGRGQDGPEPPTGHAQNDAFLLRACGGDFSVIADAQNGSGPSHNSGVMRD